MEETTRANKITIQRDYAPTRLSEETLISIYDRVLRVAAEHHDEQRPLEPTAKLPPNPRPRQEVDHD